MNTLGVVYNRYSGLCEEQSSRFSFLPQKVNVGKSEFIDVFQDHIACQNNKMYVKRDFITSVDGNFLNLKSMTEKAVILTFILRTNSHAYKHGKATMFNPYTSKFEYYYVFGRKMFNHMIKKLFLDEKNGLEYNDAVNVANVLSGGILPEWMRHIIYYNCDKTTSFISKIFYDKNYDTVYLEYSDFYDVKNTLGLDLLSTFFESKLVSSVECKNGSKDDTYIVDMSVNQNNALVTEDETNPSIVSYIGLETYNKYYDTVISRRYKNGLIDYLIEKYSQSKYDHKKIRIKTMKEHDKVFKVVINNR